MGIGITSYTNLVYMQETVRNLGETTRNSKDLRFIYTLGRENFELITLLAESRSQLRQDLFVLSETKHPINRPAYFVEFGAADGIKISNTYLLETRFSWQGILVEPGKIWESELKKNRPNAKVDTRCVWRDSNSILTFNEVDIPELSTVDKFSDKDSHSETRLRGKKYEVQTISLYDLLIEYQAPNHIDYLSIDTEGSEYEILNAFNFDVFSFGVITVEHNYTPQRDLIFALLTSHGYKRKYEEITEFEDWYVKS